GGLTSASQLDRPRGWHGQRARPLWRSLQDAGSSPRCCRPAGLGPRPCPPLGRLRPRCRGKRYADPAGPWGGWRRSPRRAGSDFVLLADAGLVGEPDFYCVAVDALLARDRLQTGGEAFLKSSIAPAA